MVVNNISKQTLSLFILFSTNAQESSEPETRASGGGLVGSGDITNSPVQKFCSKQSFSQVDHLTGTANVQIPLFTIDTYNVSIPLSLSYSARGLMKDQLKSPVGSNWKFNGECRISRVVIGQPDEGGYLTGDGKAAGSFNAWNSSFEEKYNSGFDGEPDLYMYELPTGMSGMFIINFNKDIIQVPYQDVKIEWKNNTNYGDSYFIITDPQGIIFRFGVTSAYREITTNENLKRSKRHISSWLLTSVNRDETTSIVNYSYKSLGAIETSVSNVQYTFKHKMVIGHPRTLEKAEPISFVSSTQTLTLNEISWGSGKIKMNTNKDKINSLSLCDRLGGEYKKIVFDIDTYNIVSTKTFLKRVYQQNAGVETTIANFDYYFPENIDDEYIFADMTEGYDTYGFYNGKHDFNVNKYPSYNTQGGDWRNTRVAISGADREPNIYYAKYGSLKRVYYPESGYIELEYEAHKRVQPSFITQHTGRLSIGGLRIKKISEYNSKSTSPVSSTSYEYDVEDGLKGGCIYTRFIHDALEVEKRTEPGLNNMFLIYQIPKNPTGSYFDISGAAIHYPEVKEVFADGSYSIYRYTSFADNNDEPATNKSQANPLYQEDFTNKVRPSARFYKRGLLTSLEKYSNSDEKVFEERYTYESIPVFGITAYNLFISMSYTITAPGFEEYQWVQRVGQYNWSSERVLMKSKTLMQGPTNRMQKEEYVYGAKDLQVREVKISDTTTVFKYVKLYYPQDYNSDSSRNILALKELHKIASPIAILSGSSASSISEGVVNVYQDYENRLSEVRKLQSLSPISATNASVVKAINYVSFDEEWEQNPIQFTYNGTGLIETRKCKFSALGTKYYYDYNSRSGTHAIGVANNIDISMPFCVNSFEDYYLGTPDINAKTGSCILKAGTKYYISLRGASDSDKFILTYWTRPLNSINWKFVKTHFVGRSYDLISSADIDEVRVYPANAVVSTVTHNADLSISSETDANNHTTYYKYNALGMPIHISTEKGIILKTINY